MNDSINTSSIQSVDRALRILELIWRSPAPLSVKELSELTSLKRPTVNGLVVTLYRNGYISRDDVSGKYMPGVKLFALCHDYPHQRSDLQQIMDAWSGMAGQFPPEFNFHLGLYDGNQQALVIRFISANRPQPLHVYNTMPLHASGIGKCLLAYSPELQQDSFLDMLPLPVYTHNTITDKATLLDVLAQIRENGYAWDFGEYLENTFCLAFPVLNARNQIIAAVSVSSSQEMLNEYRETLLRNGLQISKLCSMQQGWAP